MNFKRLAQTAILSCCCLFSLLSCTSSNSLQKSNEEFLKTNAPTLLPWSEQVNPSPLTVTDSITLEELDYFVISDIRDWDVDFDNRKFAITEVRSGGIFLYDLTSGKLIKGKIPKIDLTDSVALKFPYDITKLGNNLQLTNIQTIEELVDTYNLNDKDLKQFRNTYEVPRFIDGKLYGMLLAYIPVKNINKRWTLINLTLLTELDNSLQIKKFILFDPEQGYSTLPLNFAYNKLYNSFLVSNEALVRCNRIKNDSINPILVEFSKDGRVIREAYNQRSELNTTYSKRSRQINFPIMGRTAKTIAITTPYDPVISFADSSKTFKLKYLPYNIEGSLQNFEIVNKEYSLLIKANKQQQADSALLKFFPIRIDDIIDIHGNIGVIMKYWYSFKREEFKYIIQEYNMKGELLSQNIYIPEAGKKPSQFSFDNKTNQLITLSFVNEKWQLERRAWRKAK